MPAPNRSAKLSSKSPRREAAYLNNGMNAEPPTARFRMEHQPLRPGYARRSTIGFVVAGFGNHEGHEEREGWSSMTCPIA
jgi:hypothetical protein